MRETLATILWEGWTALVLCTAAVLLPGSEATSSTLEASSTTIFFTLSGIGVVMAQREPTASS